jgi:hypothetical protein
MPPVYPIDWAPLTPSGYYRHLSKRDLVVWERWLAAHEGDWDMVAYDVALGGAMPAAPEVTEADKLGFKYSTALKIDALVRRADHYAVIEVKPECTVAAVGSALCYVAMLQREEPGITDVGPMVVCEFASGDLRWLAQQFGVTIETA